MMKHQDMRRGGGVVSPGQKIPKSFFLCYLAQESNGGKQKNELQNFVLVEQPTLRSTSPDQILV